MRLHELVELLLFPRFVLADANHQHILLNRRILAAFMTSSVPKRLPIDTTTNGPMISLVPAS